MSSEQPIEEIAKLLATSPNRRGMVRLFAGAALGGGLGLTALVPTEAKKSERCRPGRRVGIVSVPANGDTVASPVLLKGRRYRIRAAGTVRASGAHEIDAEYYYERANPEKRLDQNGNTDFGLSIDGNRPDWGGYDPDHVYEREVVGTGRRHSLRLVDATYDNNSGTLLVHIFCA